MFVLPQFHNNQFCFTLLIITEEISNSLHGIRSLYAVPFALCSLGHLHFHKQSDMII